jgi:hypothetical protein
MFAVERRPSAVKTPVIFRSLFGPRPTHCVGSPAVPCYKTLRNRIRQPLPGTHAFSRSCAPLVAQRRSGYWLTPRPQGHAELLAQVAGKVRDHAQLLGYRRRHLDAAVERQLRV